MKDGRISECWDCNPVSIDTLHNALQDTVIEDESVELAKDDSKSDGKLVIAEEIQEGRISGNSGELEAKHNSAVS